MAVPTITAVSPAVGLPGGGYLVKITGTGFRTWTIPAASAGPGAAYVSPVAVRFGGAESEYVVAVSDTVVYARVPQTPLEVVQPDYGEGAVDVEVRNVDASGVDVAGEVVTAAGAFAYQRPQLAVESDLQRLTRTMLRALRAQVIANVSITTHTDYADSDKLEFVDAIARTVAEMPALVIFGVTLSDDLFYRDNQDVKLTTGLVTEVRRSSDTVSVGFDIVGVSDNPMELLGLLASTRVFFRRNRYVAMLRDPSDPGAGTVRYVLELAAGGDLRVDPSASTSNVGFFSGRFMIRGFDIEDDAGFSEVVDMQHTVTEDAVIEVTSI